MKAFMLAAVALLLAATTMFGRTASFNESSKETSAGASAPSPAPQNQAPQNEVNAPAAQSSAPTNTAASESGGAAPLRVMVGKSLLINTTERLKRVSVTDPSVADALVVTPTQVLVNGLAPGEVSLLIWDELERSRSFDLRVDVDITAASEEMHHLFPNEEISPSMLARWLRHTRKTS